MRNRVVALTAVLCLAVFAGKKPAAESRQFLKQIPEDQKILQALNRLTFGPRPGDVQAVKAVGLKVWIDRQLHPESIPPNPALADKLKTMDTLAMTGAEIVRSYPTPQVIQAIARGQMPMPTDPDKKLLFGRMVERYRNAQNAGGNPNGPPPPDAKKLAEILTRE